MSPRPWPDLRLVMAMTLASMFVSPKGTVRDGRRVEVEERYGTLSPCVHHIYNLIALHFIIITATLLTRSLQVAMSGFCSLLDTLGRVVYDCGLPAVHWWALFGFSSCFCIFTQ